MTEWFYLVSHQKVTISQEKRMIKKKIVKKTKEMKKFMCQKA